MIAKRTAATAAALVVAAGMFKAGRVTAPAPAPPSATVITQVVALPAVPDLPLPQPYTLCDVAGWQMVGATYTVTAEALRVYGPDGVLHTWPQAVALGYVDPMANGYDPAVGGYRSISWQASDSRTFDATRGVWVFTKVAPVAFYWRAPPDPPARPN